MHTSFEQLVELFHPFVEPFAVRRLEEEDKSVSLFFKLLKFKFLFLVCSVYTWITDKEFRDYWKESRAFKEKVDEQEEQELDRIETVEELVRVWTTSLFFFARKNGKVELSALDEMMLPPTVAEYPPVYELISFCTLLTADDAQSILRAVKNSLPNGQLLPAAAVEYLQFAGITVID